MEGKQQCGVWNHHFSFGILGDIFRQQQIKSPLLIFDVLLLLSLHTLFFSLGYLQMSETIHSFHSVLLLFWLPTSEWSKVSSVWLIQDFHGGIEQNKPFVSGGHGASFLICCTVQLRSLWHMLLFSRRKKGSPNLICNAWSIKGNHRCRWWNLEIRVKCFLCYIYCSRRKVKVRETFLTCRHRAFTEVQKGYFNCSHALKSPA